MITRGQLLRRASATAAGLAAVAATGVTPSALAATHCSRQPYQQFGTCRNCYGPPSCSSSRVVCYSPNNNYYDDCSWVCPNSCRCTPIYWQAFSNVCNTGKCYCGGKS